MSKLLSFLLVLMCISNFSMVFATGEYGTIFNNRVKFDDFRLFNLSEDDINSVVIHSHIFGDKKLTTNEVHLLNTILHKVSTEYIEPFRGPSPKGGPTRMSLFLKSGDKLTLTLNGEYILYEGNRVYLPEFREFMYQIMKLPH